VVRSLVENVRRSMQAVPARDGDGNPIGEYRYEGAVANKALELLGRHLGMFVEKQEIAVRRDDDVICRLFQQLKEQHDNTIDDAYIKRIASKGVDSSTPSPGVNSGHI